MATQQSCNLVPTAQTIVALVGVLVPTVAPASAALDAAAEMSLSYENPQGGASPAVEDEMVSFVVRGVQIDAFVAGND